MDHQNVTPVTCLNCHHRFEGKFCNLCGQKAATKRLDAGTMLHDLQHSFIHFEHAIFYNLSTIWRPQRILEYIEGKRVKFFGPLGYLLIATGAYIIVMQLIFPHNSDQKAQIIVVEGGETTYNIGRLIGVLALKYGKYLTGIAAVPFALSSALMFRRSKLHFWEHLYMHIFTTANFSLVAAAILWIWNKIEMPIHFGVVYLGLFTFFFFKIFQADEKRRVRLFFTSLMATLVGFAFYFLLILILGWAGILLIDWVT